VDMLLNNEHLGRMFRVFHNFHDHIVNAYLSSLIHVSCVLSVPLFKCIG